MKKNSKGKAILKLIRWSIFFLIIIIFCIISSIITSNRPLEKENINKPTVENPIKKEDNLKDLNYYLTKIKESNISYIYKIKNENESYTFKGAKNSNIEEGYKESNNGIIKYHIENDMIYQDIMGERNLITNLYEDLEENYLNITKLINILLPLNFTQNETNYSYNDNNLNYQIIVTNDFISNIKITKNNTEYILNYEVIL